MQSRNKILDDISHMMSNAMGVAQGAKDEAETAMKGWVDRWLADRKLVTREEFDAVAAMAKKAREENAALKARLDALEKGGTPKASAQPAATARKTATRKPAAKKPATGTKKD
jgi:BMFP domain-containing protein YqiC